IALAPLQSALELERVIHLPVAVELENRVRRDVAGRLALERVAADHRLVGVVRGRVDEVVGIADVETESDERRFAAAREVEREIVRIDGVDERLQALRTIPYA